MKSLDQLAWDSWLLITEGATLYIKYTSILGGECRARAGISLEFFDKGDMFRVRMVEKIYHIEQYKHEVLKKEGQKLSGEAATLEWMQKYAPQSPSTGDGK